MAKITDKAHIQDGLHIYKQDNSSYWYSRFVLNGVWYSKATRKKDKSEATNRAIELMSEYRTLIKNNVTIPRTKRAKQYLFPDVADLAIKRMKSELKQGSGKVSFNGYIQTLNKYHKVFDEALIQKYMVISKIPTLSNTGVASERRASFTEEEFTRLVNGIPKFKQKARTKKSSMIRELLENYIVVAANTGARPGTEMENILWRDISIAHKKRNMPFFIVIRKGKTTAHTGARKIVCRDEVLLAFMNLQDTFPDRKPTDKVFLLGDGTQTRQLGKAFTQLLKDTKMEHSSEGRRTLYSLRHSYITWQLKAGVSPHILAKQCGTSIKMLDEFYSHVVPEMFTDLLSGYMYDDEEEDKPKPRDPRQNLEEQELTKKLFDEWKAEIAERGCI